MLLHFIRFLIFYDYIHGGGGVHSIAFFSRHTLYKHFIPLPRCSRCMYIISRRVRGCGVSSPGCLAWAVRHTYEPFKWGKKSGGARFGAQRRARARDRKRRGFARLRVRPRERVRSSTKRMYTMKRGENSGLTPPCGSQTDEEGPGDKAVQEMDRWTHVQTDRCMDEYTHAWTKACMDGPMHGRMHAPMHRFICKQPQPMTVISKVNRTPSPIHSLSSLLAYGFYIPTRQYNPSFLLLQRWQQTTTGH